MGDTRVCRVPGGCNDKPLTWPRELAELLQAEIPHVNLIPMNTVSELPFHDPAAERLRAFVEVLDQSGVTATVRKRKGADIDAACGQLRLQHEVSAGGPAEAPRSI